MFLAKKEFKALLTYLKYCEEKNNMPELRIEFDFENNQSLAFVDNQNVGECQYEIKDGAWYIMHTGVRPEFGGRGIARMLVEKVVEEANKRNVKIVPICSYAQKVLSSNK